MAQSISINGVKVVVESLLGRRKLKNSYEYGAQSTLWLCGSAEP